MSKMIIKTVVGISVGILLFGCGVLDEAEKTVSDVEGLIALEKVKFSTDTVTFTPFHPEGTFDSTSPECLDAENYGLNVVYTFKADNGAGSSTAKFDGAKIGFDIGRNNQEIIDLYVSSFSVDAGVVTKSVIEKELNGKTNKGSCKYAFEQMVSDTDIDGDATPVVHWVINPKEGDITVDPIDFAVTPDVTPETKIYLQAALDNGVFN